MDLAWYGKTGEKVARKAAAKVANSAGNISWEKIAVGTGRDPSVRGWSRPVPTIHRDIFMIYRDPNATQGLHVYICTMRQIWIKIVAHIAVWLIFLSLPAVILPPPGPPEMVQGFEPPPERVLFFCTLKLVVGCQFLL